MNLPFSLPESLLALSLAQVLPIAVLIAAVIYWRRAGILLSRLEVENRKLKRGLRGYEKMEEDHLQLSQEARERTAFQSELVALIPRLAAEKTVLGIAEQLVDFTLRSLSADEASLYLAEGGTLALKATRGTPPRSTRIRLGEGKIGAVAEFRRVMTAEDFQNLDAATRSALSGSAGTETVAAGPLVAHGKLLGVLHVGGGSRAKSALVREVVSVATHLGATALESQINFERLEREATTDGLTSLSNVRNFKEKLRQELARASRFGRPLSVFLMDIDHFKNYNDKNGHPAGDECLRLTARILRTSSRATDLPARYGGEEFIVLLPETDRAGALAFAEKIRAAVAATDYPFKERQPMGFVSISGGAATFPIDGADGETLIAGADQALYRCKHGGRNQVAAAEPLSPAAPAQGLT